MSLHQLIHLVRILIVLGHTELHIDLVIFGKSVVHMLNTLHHVFLHGLCLVQRRVLRQITHRVAWTPHDITLILLIQSCDDFHQRRLTSAIQSDNTYLRPIEETQIDVFQHLFLILLDGLAHANHREDHLLIVYCRHTSSVIR